MDEDWSENKFGPQKCVFSLHKGCAKLFEQLLRLLGEHTSDGLSTDVARFRYAINWRIVYLYID